MIRLSDLYIGYGVQDRYLDVTQVASMRCIEGETLTIPAGDFERAALFGDPIPGTLKHIIVKIKGVDKGVGKGISEGEVATVLHNQELKLNVLIDIKLEKVKVKNIITKLLMGMDDPSIKLETIHRHLKMIGGNIRDEYPEQLMTVSFINENAKVLEIGSNIGRNTLTIASILKDESNLVTLESDINTCKILEKNMLLNDYKFHIEPSALSYRKLIQKEWETIPSDVVLPGYTEISCISFQDLEKKYAIQFDTLIADCEGALYYIFSDYPDMLDNIHTVIMENDYHNIDQKKLVDDILMKKGFSCIYFRSGGWGPCFNNFYETWRKPT